MMFNTNSLFNPGKLTTVMDGGAGSSGKGKLGAFITEHADNWQFACNTFMPQAGHWVRDDKGGNYFYQTFNSCAYQDKYERMLIGPGSIIELPALFREIEESNIDPKKIGISPTVAILQDIDAQFERGEVDLDGNGIELGDGTMKHGCFTEDTKVLMADGTYKNINKIKVGESVINQEGIPVKVLKVIDQGFKKVVKVKMSCWHKPFYVTPDHKFWIGSTDGLKKLKGLAKIIDRPNNDGTSKYTWRKISDNENSVFLRPINVGFGISPEFVVDLAKYNISGVVTESHVKTTGSSDVLTKRYIKSCYDLGYIVGFFLGDGCARVETSGGSEIGKVNFYLNSQSDQVELTKLNKAINNVFGIEPKISNPKPNLTIVTIYNKMIAKWLNCFYNDDRIKRIDPEYIVNDEDYLEGLYDGLIGSDGHVWEERNAKSFANTNDNIIELLYFIHIKFGLSFGCSYRENNDSGICSNTKESFIIRTHLMNKSNSSYIINKLQSYEELDEEMHVWDIEVDCLSHSFIANNCIVHNSTCHGVGAARARRILRRPNTLLARDIPELQEFICDVPGEVMRRLDAGQAGLLEVAQGFQLSYCLSQFYPYCTSRNCTVMSGLDDMMVPPKYAGQVVLNFRTFPIRIANDKYVGEDGHHLTWEEIKAGVPHTVYKGSSGPGYDDQEETTWEFVTKESGSEVEIVELTSVTKMPRRVFTFSAKNLLEAIRYNDTGHDVHVSVNFANYVDAEMKDKRGKVNDITPKFRNWLAENIVNHLPANAKVSFFGTGALTDDMLYG